jgi:hypothetical protein
VTAAVRRSPASGAREPHARHEPPEQPGTSAGFMISGHVWARDLKRAIAETDGVPFAEGVLTPEAVAAIQA